MNQRKVASELIKVAELLIGGKPDRLESSIQSRLNREFDKISSGKGPYYEKIPVATIFDLLKKEGLVAIQEDNTPWEGFLVGREGRASFDISKMDDDGRSTIAIKNVAVHLTWYKMESGTYEVTVHIS